jgi:hypothetical protein
MATLSRPRLSIDVNTTSDPIVTATVIVQLTTFEKFLVSNGLGLELRSRLVGNDAGLTGGDNKLFDFPSQNVTNDGTFVFQATVSENTLNEDNGRDEIYANFNLVSNETSFPLNQSASSPDVEGDFS